MPRQLGIRTIYLTMGLCAALVIPPYLSVLAGPLHKAAEANDFEEVVRLIDQGADVNAIEVENEGTALHWAAIGGGADIIELLLDKGAEIDAKAGGGLRPPSLAAMYGRYAAVELLVERGADVNAHDAYGSTPLHFAAQFSGHL